MLVTQIIR